MKIKNNIKDTSGLVSQLISELSSKGSVRLIHFGVFKTVQVVGRKRYDFKRRGMVAVPRFNMVTFTPAEGLRDMLNTKGRVKRK